MIYMIKVYGPKGQKIYKIGFTDLVEKRLNQYFFHYPFVELLATREGDEELEDLIHICLYSLGCRFQIDKMGKLRLDEWFIGDINIINYVFHSSREYLERTIWINRNKAFNINDIKNIRSDGFKLLRELHKKYNKCSNLSGQKLIIGKDKKIIDTRATDFDIILFKKLVDNFKEEIRVKRKPQKVIHKYDPTLEKEVQDFLDTKFYKTGIFEIKMRLYCEFLDKYNGNKEVSDMLFYKIKDPRYRKYYNFYGTSRCRSLEYREDKLESHMLNVSKESELWNVIHNKFKIGDRLTNKDIKQTLQGIYRDLGIVSTAKATDLKKYFKLTRTRITLSDKRVENGFRLDSL